LRREGAFSLLWGDVLAERRRQRYSSFVPAKCAINGTGTSDRGGMIICKDAYIMRKIP
jgi:hypothetical protein